MKVFLGWSGNVSHQVAVAFHKWLPGVIQSIKPFISSEDIAKGARWASKIAEELKSTGYGIICVTKENAHSPWINYEAGALSKQIETASVTPFLFGLRPAEIEGPLNQFQATINTQEEIRKLVVSINAKQVDDSKLGEESLKRAFEMWWPHLEDDLSKITEAPSTGSITTKSQPEMMFELLEMTRALRRETNSLQASHEDDIGKLGATVLGLVREIERLRGDVSTALLYELRSEISNRVTNRLGDLAGKPGVFSPTSDGGVFSPTSNITLTDGPGSLFAPWQMGAIENAVEQQNKVKEAKKESPNSPIIPHGDGGK